MASALPAAATSTAATTAVVNTGFRLGEEQQFSDSDSDQSQASQRGLSPTRKEGEKPKSRKKKRKDRQAMGALTDELVDVLGGAFAAPAADSQAVVPSQQVNTDQSMVVDSESTGKKMSKRTRQNLAKMQARAAKKQAKQEQFGENFDPVQDNVLRMQIAAAERRGITLEDYRKMRNKGGGRAATKATARRQKKHESRAKAKAAEGDKMEIG